MTLRRHLLSACSVLLFVVPLSAGTASLQASVAAPRPHAPSRTEAEEARKLLDEAPLLFERNEGQYGNGFDFVGRAAGHTFLIQPSGALVRLENDSAPQRSAQVGLTFAGSRAEAKATATEGTGGVINYYVGSDRTQWRTGVESFQRLRYSGVYDGIDVEYYGRGGQLEYDLIVAPKADPRQIGIRFDGARLLCVDGDGSLVVETAAGELRHILPRVYQAAADGSRIDVAASFTLDEGTVGIKVGAYDRSRELIIDPAILWSYQFLTAVLDVKAVAVDTSGNVYIAGTTTGSDILPVNNSIPLDANPGWTNSAFVIGISSGKSVLFATYIGGSGADTVVSMATATVSGNIGIYLVGQADSDDFPTAGTPFEPYHIGPAMFAAKLTTSGVLSWSTTISGTSTTFGSANAQATGMAVDASGSMYITGTTNSPDYPATKLDGGASAAATGGTSGFVTKLTADGSNLAYSTLFDGSPSAIAVDETNAAYVAASGSLCLYVSKLSPSGDVLFQNCIQPFTALAIAVDTAHDIYVAGVASSGMTLTPNAAGLGGAYGGGFYTRLDSTASTVKYATYIGARNVPEDPTAKVFAVKIDGANRAVLGATGANFQPYLGFPYTTPQANQIVRFNTFNEVEFSTDIGGTLEAIGLDTSNYIWAVTLNPFGALRRSYIITRKIDPSGSQQLSLLNINQPARLYDVPTTFKVNAEFGYFQNGMTLSVDGTPAGFLSLNGGAYPTQSDWAIPTVSAGPHSVTVVSGPNTATLENAYEYIDEPVSITSINGSTTTPSIESPLTTAQTITIDGTGFPPEINMSMEVVGSNPLQSYQLQTYRVSKHRVIVTIPPNIAKAWPGTYDLRIGNAGSNWFYGKPGALTVTGPALTEMRAVGPTTGGTILTFNQFGKANPSIWVPITGASMGGTAVTPGPAVDHGDYTTFTLTAPPHGTPERVGVTVTAGGIAYSLGNIFRYYQPVSISGLSATAGSTGGGTPITITGSGFAVGARVTMGNLVLTPGSLSSTQIVITSPPHAPGAVKLTVRNPDGGTASTDFTYSGPIITGITPSNGPATGGTSVIINVTGHDVSPTVLFGTSAATVTGRTDTTVTATTPSHAVGYVDVSVVNANGDTGRRARGFRFTSIPSITSFSPGSGGPGTSVVLTGLRFTGTTRVAFGGIDATFTVNSDTQITATVPNGALTGRITVTAGMDTGTSSTDFGVPPRFGATPFTPTSGIPGTTVTIAGANFQGTTQVTFNGTVATFTVAPSGNSITATVPAGATTGVIAVATPLGTITTSTSFTVRPVIDSFTPTSGAPGDTITISGARFTGATAVNFGAFPAASYVVVNSTSITAVVGANGGTGSITVTTPNGTATSSATFTFTGPTISGFTPDKYTGDPTSVVITGSNLSGASAVTFGGVAIPVSNYVVNSPTQITVTLHSNPQNGPITVTVGSGTATSAGYFYGVPQVTGFSPTSGAPGDIITITGNNFLGTNAANAVGFGGTSFAPSPSYVVDSNTQIRAMVPGFAATGTISVLTPYGFRTYSAGTFTVTAAPPPSLWARGVAGSASIALSWTGAIQPYDIQRGPSASGPWTYIAQNIQVLNAIDNTTSSGQAYFYRVLRVGTTQISTPDFAVAYAFTDYPITAGSTLVKKIHLTELRQAVNLMRVAAGLGNFAWTDPDPTGLPVRAVHINELRTAVTQAWNQIGVSSVVFDTDNGTLTNAFTIKAAHVNELRNAVK